MMCSGFALLQARFWKNPRGQRQRLKLKNALSAAYGYLSAPDAERAADIMELFVSSDVQAILAAKGGYGSIRVLDRLDFKLIERNRKILVGFSDITTLLLAVYSQTGTIVFHGPMPLFNFSGTADFERNSQALFQLLMGDPMALRIDLGQFGEYSSTREAVVNGTLIGGNLSALTYLVGTKYLPNLDGAILFIEDIDEEPYSIDRYLTQLGLHNALDGVKAVIIGELVNCIPTNLAKPSFTAREVISERLARYGIPIVFTNSFGHGLHMLTFPIGAEAQLNTSTGVLSLQASPVAMSE